MDDLIVFFDTETNGFLKKTDSVIGQPHVVQLAAIAVSESNRKIVNSMNVIVSPYGWDIPDNTVKVHGISKNYASCVGVPEGKALALFMCIWNDRKRVSYNNKFDDGIIDIAIKRYDSYESSQDWQKGNTECCMKLAKEALGLDRSVKLSKAYEYFVGGELKNQHDAMADTLACMQIYFRIKDAQAHIERG